MKLEGIVSKNIDARYVSGRPGLWEKVKCRPRQELIICGWEMNDARFASLILGAYRAGKLHYVGTAGTGFNSKNLPPLMKRLKPLERTTTPLQVESPRKTSSVHFVEPEVLCRWRSRPGHARGKSDRHRSRGCGKTVSVRSHRGGSRWRLRPGTGPYRSCTSGRAATVAAWMAELVTEVAAAGFSMKEFVEETEDYPTDWLQREYDDVRRQQRGIEKKYSLEGYRSERDNKHWGSARSPMPHNERLRNKHSKPAWS